MINQQLQKYCVRMSVRPVERLYHPKGDIYIAKGDRQPDDPHPECPHKYVYFIARGDKFIGAPLFYDLGYTDAERLDAVREAAMNDAERWPTAEELAKR